MINSIHTHARNLQQIDLKLWISLILCTYRAENPGTRPFLVDKSTDFCDCDVFLVNKKESMPAKYTRSGDLINVAVNNVNG